MKMFILFGFLVAAIVGAAIAIAIKALLFAFGICDFDENCKLTKK